jgi:hypothetical protein
MTPKPGLFCHKIKDIIIIIPQKQYFGTELVLMTGFRQ